MWVRNLLRPADNQAYVTGWVRQFLSQARFHYSPKPLDDALSEQIFDAYNAVATKMAEEYTDELMEEMTALQEKVDARDAWERWKD